ncbi:MAG: GrpB family protein [Betaproteobacteria bacterium]|nr:GrpB family protein [Betaproteobacteria bacterium]
MTGPIRIGARHPAAESPVEVVPYDQTWPLRFATERVLLESVLGPWLAGPVAHIGSTAVPGLAAKPVIDIMAPVHSLEASHPALAAALRAGYVHFPYRAEVMHWFCKPSPEYRTHHLHLIPLGSALWNERLAFRDALRADPAIAGEYAALKRRLAADFRMDREAYTDAKGPFVRRVLAEVAARGDAR